MNILTRVKTVFEIFLEIENGGFDANFRRDTDHTVLVLLSYCSTF